MFKFLYQKGILGDCCRSLISVLLLSAALTACTGLEIEDHSYTFNEATGSAANRMLLLNVVRASKNYPLQFSRILSYTGQGRVSADFSPSFPFGADASHVYDFKPTVKFNSGVQKLDLVDLNTAESQVRLKRKLEYNDIKYYVEQRGDRELNLILSIFVEAYRVDELIYRAVMAFGNKKCDEDKLLGVKYEHICQYYKYLDQVLYADTQCHERINHQARISGYYNLRNIPTNRCEYVHFKAFSTALFLADFYIYEASVPKIKEKKAPDNTELTGKEQIVIQNYTQPKNTDSSPKSVPTFLFDQTEKTDFCGKLFKGEKKVECREGINHYLRLKDGSPDYKNKEFTLFDFSYGVEQNQKEREKFVKCLRDPKTNKNEKDKVKTPTDPKEIAEYQSIITDQQLEFSERGFAGSGENDAPLSFSYFALLEFPKADKNGNDTDSLPICCSVYGGKATTQDGSDIIEKEKETCENPDGTAKMDKNGKPVCIYECGQEPSGLEKPTWKQFKTCDCTKQAIRKRYTLNAPLELVFRSPERVVRYLGELIAVQVYNSEPSPKFIVDPISAQTAEIFTVKRGTPSSGEAVVSITDPDGEQFYIPKPDYGSPNAHRTLTTLTLVEDVLNNAFSTKDLPPVTNVTVTSPQ